MFQIIQVNSQIYCLQWQPHFSLFPAGLKARRPPMVSQCTSVKIPLGPKVVWWVEQNWPLGSQQSFCKMYAFIYSPFNLRNSSVFRIILMNPKLFLLTLSDPTAFSQHRDPLWKIQNKLSLSVLLHTTHSIYIRSSQSKRTSL